MQIHLENQQGVTAIPDAMLSQSLRSLSFRKPHETAEPAYGTLSRTLSLRLLSCDLAIHPFKADMAANRSAALAASSATALSSVVSSQSFNIPATPAAAPERAVGVDLLTLPFAQPYVFAGPDLYMELETTSQDTRPSPQHWVDAVWAGSGDHGRITELGHGGCAVSPPASGLPMHLVSTGAHPRLGGTVDLQLKNARANRPSLFMIGLHHPDLSQAPAATQTWIREVTQLSLAGCEIWLRPEFELAGTTDATGKQKISFGLPQGPAKVSGIPFNLQVALYDELSGLVEWSNGLALVAGNQGFAGQASSVLSPVRFVRDGQGNPVLPTSMFGVWQNSAPIMRFDW